MRQIKEDYVALFPGQGSQYIGMCKDYLETDPEIETLFNLANDILGWDLKDLILNGNLKTLTQSNHAQPAVFVASYCFFKKLKAQIGTPKYLMGHSLGEISAVVASGALSFQEGLNFIKRRSRLMEEIRFKDLGFAGIVVDVNLKILEEIIEELGNGENIFISAYNSPRQFMVGGKKNFEKKLDEAVFEHQGQYIPYRMVPMMANVPYHTPLMFSYIEEYVDLVDSIDFQQLKIPIFSTIESTIVEDKETLIDLLKRQLSSPVRWIQGIDFMANESIDLVEVGPGDRMRHLILERGDIDNIYAFDEK